MEAIRITSASNPLVAKVRSLHERKGRRAEGQFLIEGVKSVREAGAAGLALDLLVLSDAFSDRSFSQPGVWGEGGMPCARQLVIVPDALMTRLSDAETPQGVLAVAVIPAVNWRSVPLPNGRCIVLERVSDPGNVGTIIRTADACGFDAIFLLGGCADPYGPKVVRSAMGSLFHLPVAPVPEGEEEPFCYWLGGQGIRICATDPRANQSLWETPLASHAAILVGNEANGLTEHLFGLSDMRISIPMPGRTESLNASIAAAALLLESVRQRGDGKVRNIHP